MRRTPLIAFVFIMALFLIMPIIGKCETSSESIKRGRELHLKILARHKKIDKFYKEPYIFGGATANPLCTISVPIKDWESLPNDKKQLLATYAAGSIDQVKKNPYKYARVSPNAPAAAMIAGNVARMSADSWAIMVGSVTPDGKDILSDKTAMSGK